MSLIKGKQSASFIFALFLTVILTLLFAPPASAADSYVISFNSSPGSVQPGDYFNVTMSISSSSGEKTNAAAVQASLQYDSAMVSFVDATALDGSLIGYDDTSKMITAYGEGHEFTDSIDFITFTFQAAEEASGSLSITASDPVLGTQDGKELPVTIGSGANVDISSGAEDSSVKPASGNGANYVSADSAENSLTGSSSGSSGTSGSQDQGGSSSQSGNTGKSGKDSTSGSSGDSAASGQSGPGKNSSPASGASSSDSGPKNGGSAEKGSQTDSSDNAAANTPDNNSSASGSSSDNQNSGKSGDKKTDADYIAADSGMSGISWPVAAVVAVLIAAAAGGAVFYLRRRKR